MNIKVHHCLIVLSALVLFALCKRDSFKTYYCNPRVSHPDSFKGRLRKWKKGITENMEEADLYYPCKLGYDSPVSTEVVTMGIQGHQAITHKEKLWDNFASIYGRDAASKVLPEAWTNYSYFRRDYDPQSFYILKKNLQRKKGLKLCKTLKEVDEHYVAGNYTVIQKYLEPMLIDGRKLNIRTYLLLWNDGDNLRLFVHPTMIPIPANKKYDRDSEEEESHYTSLNVENNCTIYNHFPKTLEHVEAITPVSGRINKILENLKEVCKLRMPEIRPNSFALYGADFFVSKDRGVYLLEVNSGPQMDYKCNFQNRMKEQVFKDIFRTVGLENDGKESNFKEIS